MTTAELACTYAALILHDDGIPITAEKITALVTAAEVKIDSYWAPLFAKFLQQKNVDDLILNMGSGGGGAPVAAVAVPAAAAEAPAAKAEETKEAAKEESDEEDYGFNLFD